mgnify:CR=1 FL=1
MASMGPHSGECGKFGKIEIFSSDDSGFNGAALRRVRKVRHGKVQLVAVVASMGPHSGECGKVPIFCPLRLPSRVLQWGRTPESAESVIRLLKDHRIPLLQWGRTPESAERGRVATVLKVA